VFVVVVLLRMIDDDEEITTTHAVFTIRSQRVGGNTSRMMPIMNTVAIKYA
jgi:hypothetical protein